MYMGNYVIMKNHLYVSIPGHRKSYTTSLKYARRFQTYEQAKKEKCGNERIVNLIDKFLLG